MSIARRLRQQSQQARDEADLNKPVPLPADYTRISPHERDVDRYRAEDARTGRQVDETPPTVRYKKRGLRSVRLKGQR